GQTLTLANSLRAVGCTRQDPVPDPEMLAQAGSSVPPDEDPLELADRVDHMRDLARPGKEMLLDETVAIGEEDAEVGVGVVPADDLQRGEFRVHLGIDLRPGLVGESHLGEAGLGPFSADRLHDLDERPDLVAMPAPDQNPADLDRGVSGGVVPERSMDLGSEEHAESLVSPAREHLPRQILPRQETDVDGLVHGL